MATKASVPPSGERAKVVASDQPANRVPSGGGIWKRTDLDGSGAGGVRSSVAAATPTAAAATAHASHAARLDPTRPAGAVAAFAFRPSSTSLTSCADCQRSSGSLTRQLRTTSASAVGASARSVASGGASARRIEEATAAALDPSNARRPLAISWSTQPRAKTSLRASAALPSSCSGAMYCSVPTMAPARVIGASAVAVFSSEAPPPGKAVAMARARPKSSSFTPDFVTMTLPGLRSRCAMPLRCARSSASAISAP